MCATAHAAPKTIRVTLQVKPESVLYENLKVFKDLVAKESHGELDVQLFPSSQLYQAHEVPKAVGSGQIEMGVSLLSMYADTVPATDIFAVPFLFSLPDLFEAAAKPSSGVRAILDEAIRVSTGSQVLWWFSTGSEAMGSKGSPFLSPSDIAGKKIRVAGYILAKFINSCGGTAVIIPGSQQYAALQRGEVDAVSTGTEMFVSRQLWQLVDHVTLLHHSRQIFLVLINDKFWRSLSDDQRRILKNAALEAERMAEKQDAAIDRQSIADLSRHGMKIAEAAPDQLDDWKSCSSPVSEAFLERSGATGSKAMSEYRKLLTHWAKTQSIKAPR